MAPINNPTWRTSLFLEALGWCVGMTQRDVVGREVGGGFMFGTHVRIKDFKIKKIKN